MKIVIKWKEKGWFAALGLHHGLLTAACIFIFSLFGVGWFGAVFAIGWYAQREYGNGPYPPKTFEIMDFMSPLIIGLVYLLF